MKILDLYELRTVLEGHPELRMHMIPMDTGLLVDGHVLLIPTGEGELIGLDLAGIEEIAYEPGSTGESYMQYLRRADAGDDRRGNADASDILSSYGIAPGP